MNNDLDLFSKERLKELLEWTQVFGRHPRLEECEELIRISLAAKQAKPVGYTSSSALEDVACGETSVFGICSAVGEIPLYTTPPTNSLTVQDDTLRMNWLVFQCVEVRTPMVYGSHARFVAQCDSDDCEEYHTTLREQIDKAMLNDSYKLENK